MQLQACAKINLALRVLAREASGFHQIETLFCRLDLADDVAVTLTGAAITLDVAAPAGLPAPDLGPPEKNLAVRAAAAFAERCGTTRGVRIQLLKRVPHGAGLGGGSSNAAAVLHALNQLHDGPLAAPELMALGGELGSDVPFFLARAPFAIGWGRGNRVAPLPALPRRPVLLAMPRDRIPTADAYAALSHARGRMYTAPAALVDVRVTSWADVALVAHNDFEQVVFQRLPLQRALRAELAGAGAVIARLTGTGSAVFGIFEDDAAVEAACHAIAQAFPDVTCFTTSTSA